MKALLLIGLVTATMVAPAAALAADASQNAFKAAMIYNFARFTTWPPTRFDTTASPVVLCVAPDEPIGADLQRLEGQPVRARKLHVRQTAGFDAGCHLALLPPDTPAARLEALNQQGVLTIGETEGFSKTGAVGLVQIGRQVRFEINTRAARQGGVVLSSQLLRLAISVK